MSRCNSSVLWEFFQKLDNEKKAKCNKCGELYSFKTSTANLKTHLKRKHIDAYKRVCSAQSSVLALQKPSRPQNTPSIDQPGPSSLSSSLTPPAPTQQDSSNGGDIPYATKWYAYKEMDGSKARSKKRRVNTFWMQEAKSGDEDSSNSPPRVKLQTSAPKVQRNRHKSDCNAQSMSIYTQAIETLKAIKETKSEIPNDELSNYGMYVTAHLRKFSPQMQARAKFEINKVLYALDMESMSEGSSTIILNDNGDITVTQECKIDPLYKE